MIFRPIRRDTPRGEAAYRYDLGIQLMLVYTPLVLVMYYGEYALAWLRERQVQDIGLLEYPLWIAAVVTFLCGIAIAYDGWWTLRRLAGHSG